MPAYILRDDLTMEHNGHTLKRVQLVDHNQKLGGWIESTSNLDSDDTKTAWVSKEAKVYGSAVCHGWVGGNADVSGGLIEAGGAVAGNAVMTGGTVQSNGILQGSATLAEGNLNEKRE